MKPTIGVVPSWQDEDGNAVLTPNYRDVLEACGAKVEVFPWAAPAALAADICNHCDGVMFTGGHDIDPRRYGEERYGTKGLYALDRDEFEEFVLMNCLAHDKPVFGICRGMQLLNVLLGGSLYQDLEEQRPGSLHHPDWDSFERPSHEVMLIPGSPLKDLLGFARLAVNSRHHQGVKHLSKELVPMAYATDGLVESVYSPEYRFLWGVQWHPESMFRVRPAQLALVHRFVDACQDSNEGEY